MFDLIRSGFVTHFVAAIVALIVMFFGLGCTPHNTFPTVGMLEQVIDEGITRQTKMVETLSDQHAAMAPDIAPEIQAMVTTLAAFMNSQREINTTIASERVETANSQFANLDTLLGVGGTAGLFGLLGLGRRKREADDKETRSGFEKKIESLMTAFNSVTHSLALNAPPPPVVAVPTPASVATA